MDTKSRLPQLRSACSLARRGLLTLNTVAQERKMHLKNGKFSWRLALYHDDLQRLRRTSMPSLQKCFFKVELNSVEIHRILFSKEGTLLYDECCRWIKIVFPSVNAFCDQKIDFRSASFQRNIGRIRNRYDFTEL